MNLQNRRTHALADSRDHMKAGLGDLMTGIEDLLRSTATYSGTEIESSRDRLKRQLQAAREHTDAWDRSAVNRYRRVSSATDGYVHDHAWKTAGLAILVGIAVGACLGASHWRR